MPVPRQLSQGLLHVLDLKKTEFILLWWLNTTEITLLPAQSQPLTHSSMLLHREQQTVSSFYPMTFPPQQQQMWIKTADSFQHFKTHPSFYFWANVYTTKLPMCCSSIFTDWPPFIRPCDPCGTYVSPVAPLRKPALVCSHTFATSAASFGSEAVKAVLGCLEWSQKRSGPLPRALLLWCHGGRC